MVHNHLLLTHWLFLWYTTVFYWPNGPLFGTHPSSIGPLALPVVHYHLLLAHWPSLCDATIFSRPSCLVLWYTTFFYWSTGCLCGTLLSPTCPLAVSMVHSYLPLVHWPFLLYTTIFYWPTGPHMSLWYTTIFYWPTGYLYDALPSSSCPLAISMIHYYLLLAHWLSLWYTTICFWPIGCLCGALLSSIG